MVARGVELFILEYKSAQFIHHEETYITGVGKVEVDTCAVIERVGVVLLQHNTIGLGHERYALEIVLDFDTCSGVVILINIRHKGNFTTTCIGSCRALGHLLRKLNGFIAAGLYGNEVVIRLDCTAIDDNLAIYCLVIIAWCIADVLNLDAYTAGVGTVLLDEYTFGPQVYIR